MNDHPEQGRIARHAAAFNDAVQSGDWREFTQRFAPDAVMRFKGVAKGPFVGRAAIADAYLHQPPTDTLQVLRAESGGEVETIAFAWSSGGTGTMRFTWTDDLVAELEITFDRWTVWRQDDNGNRFEVSRHYVRADAEELAAAMEARGHRQTYWVAPSD